MIISTDIFELIEMGYKGSPKYEDAFKWIRDTFNLYHSIEIDQTMEPKFCYTIAWYKTNPDNTVEWVNFNSGQEFFLERSYEQAEQCCLIRMIEIIKKEINGVGK